MLVAKILPIVFIMGGLMGCDAASTITNDIQIAKRIISDATSEDPLVSANESALVSMIMSLSGEDPGSATSVIDSLIVAASSSSAAVRKCALNYFVTYASYGGGSTRALRAAAIVSLDDVDRNVRLAAINFFEDYRLINNDETVAAVLRVRARVEVDEEVRNRAVAVAARARSSK